MQMKAAVIYKTGEPIKVETGIEIPALARGQVLVKVAYSGVCRSQLMEISGGRGEDKYLPHLLGHEGSGVVVDIGHGVTKVAKGDRVVLTWIKGDGLDAGGTKYKKGEQTINAGGVTTLNEYAVVSENRCVKIPADMPLKPAVLLGCALPTGAGIIINEINPAKGASIAIFGLGGIGLSALMTCGLFECSQIIAVDIEDKKLALAKDFGATTCINSAKEDVVVAIKQLTSGRGVDYSVEAAGRAATIEKAFEAVRKNGGLCVFASHPPEEERITLKPHDLISGKQIRGSWGGACAPDKDILKFVRLYLQGKLPLEKLFSHSYRLDDINQAFSDLEERKVVRAIIEIDPNMDGAHK